MASGISTTQLQEKEIPSTPIEIIESAVTTNKENVPEKLEQQAAPAEEESAKSNCSLTAAASNTRTIVAMDNQYFFEDEIFRIDKKGRVKFGLVIETSETYSGDEEDEFEDVLLKGEVRVAWYPEGVENVQRESSVTLADRTLMPGDVVRRLVPGKDTQRGYCREISMRADVKVLGTKYVIKNVMAERLRLISSWQRDSAVCLDSWVGSTKDVEEKAVLRAPNGARIEISSGDFYAFKDMNSRNARGIYNPQVFYPGNVVVGRLPSTENIKLLTPNVPLHMNKKGKPLTTKFTIESVYTDAVWVHWQCKALSEESNIESNMLTQPSPCVTGDDLKRLKRLNLFESCMLQINDRNYLKYSKCDTVIRKSEWDKEQAIKFKLLLSQQLKQENQNLCVHTSSSGNNATHHYEKVKKKLSQHDVDKSTSKSKKFVLKMDKFLSPSKEKTAAPPQQDNANEQAATAAQCVTSPETGWVTVDDDDDEVDNDLYDVDDFNDDGNVSATTTMSTCSSPSPQYSPKHVSKRHALKKKAASNLKPCASGTPEFTPQNGDELVTEALLVYSTATVVWQDGSIESDIPSTQLYPIHHLDNHEFFPGDFVISGKEEATDVSFRDYGVIQTVDHHGRTARVKWFTTYTSADEPKPTYKGESEVSVYDLKDHPDFQYRPGTMVIRVANFIGEDATCTAGQIIDNFIDGRVKVWWVDGHISMSWPQDLFEVGQYDHADWGHESEDSWETESENSEFGGGSPKLSIEESHVLSNIERARVAIARLEEIFNISPNLQNPEVMRKLLNVFKGCRYLDRLLNTSFFHEDNFLGLIGLVRKGGSQSISERAQDRKNRLFSHGQPTNQPSAKPQEKPQTHQCHHYQAIVAVNSTQKLQNSSLANASPKEYAPKVLFNISSTNFKCASNCVFNSSPGSAGDCSASTQAMAPPSGSHKRKRSPAAAAEGSSRATTKAAAAKDSNEIIGEKNAEVPLANSCNLLSSASARAEESPNKLNSYNVEKNQLLQSAMLNIEKAFEKTSQLKSTAATAAANTACSMAAASQDDSGNFSRNENCDGSSTSYASSSDLTNIDTNSISLVRVNDDQKSISCSSIELTVDISPDQFCVRLCALLKEQLVKCINEIREKYYKEDNINLSDVFENTDGEQVLDTIIEVNDSSESAKANAIDNADESAAAAAALTLSLDERVEEAVAVTTPTTTSTPLTLPTTPSNAYEVQSPTPTDNFQVLPNAPKAHKYHLTIFHPTNAQQYYRAVQREHRMLKNSLPPGVWVRVFEDRMDLLSVMMEGPKKTPYEDGLFFFDIQLGREYPKSPPLCHYISYCTDRLNPNLYEDGKVCVSLLGTWSGRDTEVWTANSTLLQVLVSIQGLILVPEPYFNEAGYEKQKGSQQGKENSRMYNEMVIIKLVQATAKMLQQPPPLFRNEIYEYYKLHGQMMYTRIRGWMELSKSMPNNIEEAKQETVLVKDKGENEQCDAAKSDATLPDFPLVPASRGFCLTLAGLLDTFNAKLEALISDSTTAAAMAMAATTLSKETLTCKEE